MYENVWKHQTHHKGTAIWLGLCLSKPQNVPNEPWYKGGIVQMATTITTQTMYMVPPHPLNSEQY